MKICFLCPMGHPTIILKKEEVKGRVPQQIQCTKLRCGCAAFIHEATVMDEAAHATHEFYKPGFSDVLSVEESQYINGGGLMFREIAGAQPASVVNEFKNTEEVVRLAEFLVKEYPYLLGVGTPVDAAILLIENKVFFQSSVEDAEENFKQYIEQAKKALNGKFIS